MSIKTDMLGARKRDIKGEDFGRDLEEEVSIKINGSILVVPHDPTSILLFDQLVEAGKAFTPGPVDVAIIPGIGEMPAEDLVELSLKAKNINLEMYKHLQDLYNQLDRVDKRLSDTHYQEALDAIVWSYDIAQVFDFKLVF